MPDAVVEQTFTARRGRNEAKLRLRVFAPTPWDGNFRCKLELTADEQLVFPQREDLPGIAGADSLQAFVLALRFAAHELLRFELNHSMQIEAWEWSSLIPLIADVAVDPYTRARISEIQTALRSQDEGTRAESQAGRVKRKPRVARRKPSAANRKRRRG